MVGDADAAVKAGAASAEEVNRRSLRTADGFGAMTGRGSGEKMSGAAGVVRVAACDLRAGDGRWPYAEASAVAIDRHWARRRSETPGFFDGTVYVVGAHRIDGGRLSGTLLPVAFRSFLYWRDQGFPESGVRDGFGSALIRSAEGHILLGRQNPGRLNSGLSYLPSGLIDPRDVAGDGRVDIAASIRREVREETGLGDADLEPRPGFVLTLAGAQLSIAAEFQSPLAAAALAARIGAHIAGEDDPELAGVSFIACRADLAGLALPRFTRVLLETLID